MNWLIQFQISLYALFVLSILIIIMYRRNKVKPYSQIILLYAAYFTGIAIVMEPLSWILDGNLTLLGRIGEQVSNYTLELLGPVIAGMMMSYADYHTYQDKKRIFKRWMYQQPALFILLLLIVNPFYPIFFKIDPVTNTFSLSAFSWIPNLVIFFMYIYVVLMVYVHRKKLESYEKNIYLIFFFIPFLGSLIQLLESYIFLTWNALVVSIWVIYVFLESESTEKDHLTKLYNRRSFELYATNLIENEKTFRIYLFDLDNFKSINDILGHRVGDSTLAHFADELKRTYAPNKMVSRLAGDEFIVVDETENSEESSVEQLYQNLSAAEDHTLNGLEFSYGSLTYIKGMSIEELYESVDRILYTAKKAKKKSQ